MVHFIYGCLSLLAFTFTLVLCPFVSADSEISWNTFLGSSSDDHGYSVAADASGNLYVTGRSSTSWGAPINAHAGSIDAFVAKLDSSGGLQWHTFLGSSSSDYGFSVATDASGNLYVTGYSSASWGAPINAHTGYYDVFVAKLDSDGGLQWHTFLGSSDSDEVRSVAADASGNLYVTGYSSASWGAPINAHAGTTEAFVAKLDSDGGLQWNTFLGSSDSDVGNSVAADASGNLYVTGQSYAGWGLPINAHAGDHDAFVAKLDSDGGLQWHTFLGSSQNDYGYSVAAEANGNLYVTGQSYAGWGLPINAHAGGSDAFVAKLDSDGGLQWNTFLGSSNYDEGQSVAADASGNLYVTGRSYAGWGAPINAHAGDSDAFVAKLDSDGGLQWNTFLGTSNPDAGNSVAADASGNLYVSGYSYYSWGAPINAHAGNSDAFVAKIYDLDIDDDGWPNDLEEIISTSSSGIRYWDVAASEWTQMTSSTPTGDIASGDFTGDGKADVASIWNSGLWYQDGGTLAWTKIPGTAPDRMTAGDVTGDGRFEIIGTWSSGIWYWDVAASKWTRMTASTPTGDIAAGDFTGDGKADVASIWGSGLWYQDGAALDWIKISGTAPVSVTAGDVTGDGRSEIIGTWSNGIWYWDVAASKWTKMTASTPTGDIAAGDFTGDGKAEVASCWSSGLWYQDGATFDWTKVSNTAPTQLTAGDVTGQ